MTTTTRLKKILEILEAHGEGDQIVQADHEIIYLNPGDSDAVFADALRAEGAGWGPQEGWFVLV